MQDLTEPILELIRLTSTDLPPDVEAALRQALEQEAPGSAARSALEAILQNVEISRRNSPPSARIPGRRSSMCATCRVGARASCAPKSKPPSSRRRANLTFDPIR